MRTLLLHLAYSNTWIAFSAAAQVAILQELCSGRIGGEPCLLGFLSMYWVYTFAKAVHFDAAADSVNDPQRTEFLVRFRIPLIPWGLVGLAVGCYLGAAHSLSTLAIFLTPLCAGLAYDLKFLPRTFRYQRLKDITGVKGLTVALSWTLLTSGLAWQYRGGEAVTLGLLSAWGFLQWFINTTYFDLGDVIGDRLEGTATLPVRFGFGPTKKLLHILNVIAFLVLLAGLLLELVPTYAWTLNLLAVNNWVLLSRAKSEETDLSFECDVIADGHFIWAGLYLMVGAL